MHDFVHLHVHSEYSLLDGYATTKGIVQRAADLGMDSIALTDHGVLYGAMEFYEAAKKAGIRPIIGVEAYIAPGSLSDPMTKGAKNYFHLLLLAQNETGYRNLVKLTTRAHLDGMGKGVFARPRIDRHLLETYHEGLIVTSACVAGELLHHLKHGDRHTAVETAAYYRDLLGPDRYYIELQLHDNTPELEPLNDELVRIARELGIPLVATSDAHFIHPEDKETQHKVMAMGMNMTYAEFCTRGYAMDESYHIMSGEAMWARFKRYGTEPLENTRRISDMCRLKLEFGRVQLPVFELPEGHDAASYLRLVCEEGLMRRFNGQPPETYLRRLEYELDVINQTGFPDYMLIVWDYVKFARSRGIPCLPRGSAGASLVLYALGITDVDPVKNKLLFERFLSPERLEMPDIDTDFADSRRQEILDYIANKYGRENVAQIITYGTLGAKAAIRDMGRVLGLDPGEVDRVAKLIPSLPVGTTIAQAIERVPELKQIYETQPHLRELLIEAQKVEGRMRSVGTHACGVVVSRTPLEELVPLQRTTKDEHALMAAFEGATLAKMGLLKMDILGLTNLSVVAEALKYIEQTTGRRMWLDEIPLDDPKVFAALGRGETKNVFQLESAGMTRYLMQLQPTRVEDLYAMVALYRPGPLEQIPVYIQNKHNPSQIRYLHPVLEPILSDTYGVIVYQEQIMQLLQTVADYTLGQAYIVIKAISKKNKELMAENEAIFKQGCQRKGISKEVADQLWELILPFAGYSFNRPHATLYGLLSYQTAWLKVNYPVEYMTAVLTGAGGVIEDVTKAALEARRLGVAVLPPDVNRSHKGFTIEPLSPPLPEGVKYDRGIRFGLMAIKNVGEGPVEAIIAAREAGGPFRSLEDLCARVDRHALNKRTLESLIKAGALDSLPGSRRQKLAILDQAINAGVEAQKARDIGQSSLFDIFGESNTGSPNVARIPLPIITETPAEQKEVLRWEKELLGLNLSDDPIAKALEGIDLTGVTDLGSLEEEHVGETLTFVGVLSGVRRIATKKGDSMVVATLEDMTGSIEIVVFPKVLAKAADLLQNDAVVRVTAKVDNRRDTPQLVVESVETPSTIDQTTSPQPVEMDLEGMSDELSAELATDVPISLPDPSPQPPSVTTVSSPPAPSVTTTPPTAKPPTVRPRQPVKLANGNGQGNSNGQSKSGEPPRTDGPPSRNLRIYLPRTNNFDADVALMQHIHSLLSASQGNDHVTLYLPNGVGMVVLQSQQTIELSDALLNELRQLLGHERVLAA
ncbi:DNA polymerase III subunit alpha [Chloroflexus aggregans]|uniref:DNA polymerase III subunit alpha n=1 Tax=Chloroflexus aggregans (strain MD-66 / DSM 9485) TaxID=326427 RepID=B8G3W8_CHLAD|nr:DNA polymerase III subunit alpha [Chloroflexus aggregans]ACL25370.1 DNA polymerase III, alpha subunit [Chloroflexus aggregans DSM 9485]